MQKALLNFRTLLSILARIWNKQAGPSDFVWLARFRLLAIYVILKAALLLAVGLVGMRINTITLPSPLSFILLHWIITILSPFLLLLEFAIVSCTTPLFVERISRYAKSYEQSKYELLSIQHKLDMLLRRYSQELARGIQSERLSLSRELHDGLMQELSAILLQLSTLLMRNSVDGNVQLSAAETANLEASLRRVIAEARSVMQELKTPQPILEQ